MPMRFWWGAVAAWLLLAGAQVAPPDRPVLTDFQQPGLSAEQLGVIVNDDDPDSATIAAYYQEKRRTDSAPPQ